MIRKKLSQLAVGATLVTSVSLASFAHAATSETKEFDSKVIREVEIENNYGDIKIIGGSEIKTIVTIEKVQFGPKCKLEIAERGGKLSIDVDEKGVFTRANCNVNLTLAVPKTVDLDIENGSGSINVMGTSGQIDYKIGSGEVNIDASIVKLEGKAGSGSAKIKGLLGEADLKSGSGDFDLVYTAVPTTGELEIKSGSGNTKVSMPAASKLALSSLTGSGTTTNELGDTKDASFKVSFRAGSGNLSIVKQ